MRNNSKLDKSTKLEIFLIIAATFLIGGYVVYDVLLGGPLTTFLRNRDAILAVVESAGFFAPLAFVFLQTLQTVLAPLPGQVFGMLGGYIFGWWGIAWTLLGNAVGYFIIFEISKKFGRPLLEKLISEKTLKKFDFLNSKKSAFVILLIFLLPGLPDDIVGYVAGLSGLPLKTLMSLAIIGHIPSTVASTYIGMGLGNERLFPVVLFSLILVIIFIIAVYNREKIMKKLRKLSEKS